MFERGLEPTIAKDANHLHSKRANFDIVVEMSYLGKYDRKMTASIKGNVVIYTLRDFVDSNVASMFDLNYHQYLLKVGFKLFLFDAVHVSSMNIHGVNFFTKLATAGAEYGATFAIAMGEKTKITERLKMDLEDAGILFFSSLSNFFADEEILTEAFSGTATAGKNQAKLTKKSVSALPNFINATIYTIEIMSGLKAVKGTVELRQLKLGEDDMDCVACSIGFYGDIEGILIFIMKKKLIIKSCALLLDEENNSDEDVLDAFGELANIIGGKAKTYLQNDGVSINITLPRTFNSIEELEIEESGKKGVFVNFDFEDEPFYFFLTGS
jgi:CheY-specific phosphatase CheX